jgi:hypothetical protein
MVERRRVVQGGEMDVAMRVVQTTRRHPHAIYIHPLFLANVADRQRHFYQCCYDCEKLTRGREPRSPKEREPRSPKEREPREAQGLHLCGQNQGEMQTLSTDVRRAIGLHFLGIGNDCGSLLKSTLA